MVKVKVNFCYVDIKEITDIKSVDLNKFLTKNGLKENFIENVNRQNKPVHRNNEFYGSYFELVKTSRLASVEKYLTNSFDWKNTPQSEEYWINAWEQLHVQKHLFEY